MRLRRVIEQRENKALLRLTKLACVDRKFNSFSVCASLPCSVRLRVNLCVFPGLVPTQPAGQASGGSASCIVALGVMNWGYDRGGAGGDDADEAMSHAVVFFFAST